MGWRDSVRKHKANQRNSQWWVKYNKKIIKSNEEEKLKEKQK